MFTSPWQKPFRGMQINKAHPLARGLVGCWVMNEATGDKVFDSSGSGNKGTNNGADWVADGLDFNGTSDYVDMSDVLNLTDAITVVSLFKTDTNNVSQGIVSKKSQAEWGSNVGYSLNIRADRGILFKVGTAEAYTSNAIMNAGNWYCVVGKCTIGAPIEVFVNNVEINYSTQGTPSGVGSSTDNLIVGRYYGTVEFNGIIAYTLIYNREISTEEVAWLNREPYAMFQQPISPASLYYEAGAPTLGIPIAMYHYQHH